MKQFLIDTVKQNKLMTFLIILFVLCLSWPYFLNMVLPFIFLALVIWFCGRAGDEAAENCR